MRRPTAFTNGLVLAIAFFMLIQSPFQSSAQCSTTLKTISYNTVLTGTGNNSWGFLFPQFNPSAGTLVAVSIRATISVSYGFSLENNSSTPVSLGVSIMRRDSISSSDLSSPIYKSLTKNYGTYNLDASDGIVGSGPDEATQGRTIVLNNFVISDSIVDAVAPFMGINYISFDYSPATTPTITGGTGYSFTASANDTMNFSITYYYCDPTILPVSLTDFTASKQNDQRIRLSWTTTDEITNRIYVVEKSDDGIGFSQTDSIKSIVEKTPTAYSDIYFVSTSAPDKIYFRLKIIDVAGDISYSDIRMVDLDGMIAGITLYPNPSFGFINLIFNGAPGNWQTEIFADNGQLIQRNYFTNVSEAHISFINKLASGVYFVQANEQHYQKKYLKSFVIR